MDFQIMVLPTHMEGKTTMSTSKIWEKITVLTSKLENLANIPIEYIVPNGIRMILTYYSQVAGIKQCFSGMFDANKQLTESIKLLLEVNRLMLKETFF